MSRNELFFKNPKQLSQPKLKIYKEYFKKFINNLRPNEEGIIFDGFAGQGKYEKKENENDQDLIDTGSPLLALQAGIEYLNKNEKCNLKFVFVEQFYTNYKILCKNVMNLIFDTLNDHFIYGLIKTENEFELKINEIKNEKINIYFSIEIRNCDYIEQINRFDKLKDNERLLSILDPFGYIDLSFDDISKLIGQNKEILVTFMVNAISRHKNIYKNSILKLLRINENEFKDLDGGPFSYATKFGNYLSKLNNKSNLKPIYFELKSKSNLTIYFLIFVTNSFTSYNQIYDIFEKNSSFLHSKDRFEYSLCVANEKSIDLNKNYLVQDILDTKLLNRKRLYLIKWKNKSTNSWETNEIIRFNKKILTNFHKKMDDDIYDAEESSEEEHDLVEEFIDKEMKVKRILGATIHPISKEMFFLAQIKNKSKNVWLDRKTAHCKCPQKVIINFFIYNLILILHSFFILTLHS
jgi:three-Cys-motif partner protein